MITTGDKVTPISSTWRRLTGGKPTDHAINHPDGSPQLKHIYLVVGTEYPSGGELGIFLAGCRAIGTRGQEISFVARAFRKVVPRAERIKKSLGIPVSNLEIASLENK
jgi:hypothetical protein